MVFYRTRLRQLFLILLLDLILFILLFSLILILLALLLLLLLLLVRWRWHLQKLIVSSLHQCNLLIIITISVIDVYITIVVSCYKIMSIWWIHYLLDICLNVGRSRQLRQVAWDIINTQTMHGMRISIEYEFVCVTWMKGQGLYCHILWGGNRM